MSKAFTTPAGRVFYFRHRSRSKILNWIGLCSVLSPPTQYSLYGRRFLQVKRPNQQYQSTEGDATKEKAKNENN